MNDVERLTAAIAERYRLERELGRGGMATVYLAEDLKHRRPVAIKVLRPELGAALGGERFLREIKIAAKLRHPHILTLIDSGEADGLLYYVMPYVEGESLRHRLDREKQLPLDETLRITREVADALRYANSLGILHRDIKPENILLEGGHAIVADFGIAHALGAAGAERLTRTGVAVGTPSYMSPEQASGERVPDARSDLYSLGCVVYEMLAGQPPFTGATPEAILARKLVDRVPSLRVVRETVPEGVEKAIVKALARVPADRFATVAQFADALNEQARARSRLRPVKSWGWRAGLATGLVLITLAALRMTRREPLPTAGAVLRQLTTDAGLTIEPSLSPDGSLVAFASDRAGEGNLDIWIQQVAGGEPVRLTRHPADERQPRFSPDGTRVAFRSERDGGGIYVVPALGGEPALLAPGGLGPLFSPDGQWLAYHTGVHGASLSGGTTTFGAAKLYIVRASGGTPLQIQPDAKTATPAAWSPDSRHLLILADFETGIEALDWWVTPVDGAATQVRREPLLEQGLGAPFPVTWLPGNRIVFSARWGDSRNHWVTALSGRDWQVRGRAQRLTSGAGIEGLGSLAAAQGVLRLAFPNVLENVDLWSVPLARDGLQASGPPVRLTQDAARDRHPTLAAQGDVLIYSSDRQRRYDLWVRDLVTGRETQLVSMPPYNMMKPVLSADGSKLAFWQQEGQGQPSIAYVTELRTGPDGSLRAAAPRALPSVAAEGSGWPWSWSPSGDRLWYDPARWPRLARNYLHDGVTGERVADFGHPEHDLSFLHLSPDGRWLAFMDPVDDNVARLVVTPVRNGQPAALDQWISIAEGDHSLGWHAWSPAGDVLYYLSNRDGYVCVWAQRLTPSTMRPAGPPVALYHAHSARLSIRSIGNNVRGLAAARGRVVFNMSEMVGNVWMTDLSTR